LIQVKISARLEAIFSHAAGMAESGKTRCTVYAYEDTVYLVNEDHTLYVRFPLRKGEKAFDSPVSFNASDFVSGSLKEENGRVVFTTKADGMIRRKVCRTARASFDEIDERYEKYRNQFSPSGQFEIPKSVLGLLDPDLSHIEFHAIERTIHVVQRNIYDSSILDVFRDSDGLGLDEEIDQLPEDWGPVAVRTPDLAVLFAYVKGLEFIIPEGGNYLIFSSVGNEMEFEGILAECIYDELGTIEES
jgi:hypothetical protein